MKTVQHSGVLMSNVQKHSTFAVATVLEKYLEDLSSRVFLATKEAAEICLYRCWGTNKSHRRAHVVKDRRQIDRQGCYYPKARSNFGSEENRHYISNCSRWRKSSHSEILHLSRGGESGLLIKF